VESIKSHLASGSLGDGIEIIPFEPLSIDAIELKRGDEFDVQLMNLEGKGVSNFTIKKLRVNLRRMLIDALVHHPTIDFLGKYKLKVQLGLFNIKGDGDVTGTISWWR